jgi:hypothetical protein
MASNYSTYLDVLMFEVDGVFKALLISRAQGNSNEAKGEFKLKLGDNLATVIFF